MTFEERAKELVSKMTFAEKMAQLRFDAPAIERLGVPAYNWWNEALHGVARAGRATVFPQAIAMAASFDPALLETVADAISDEGRAKYNEYKKMGSTEIYQGINYWSPNINIFRDPRWGRGHETYGECPYLTAQMGIAFIRGIQGDGKSRYRKADATVKHFYAHSGPEALRHGFDVVLPEEELEQTYLSAFRACIEQAHPAAVMGAYSAVNGEPCCGSEKIIDGLLRGKLGFDGYFVSDCGAICDINEHHHKTKNKAESAALALNAGCDLNCGEAYRALTAAAAAGLVDEETVTRSCVRLFAARYRLGMFDDDCPYDALTPECVESPAHRALSLKMAQEGMVLLKNDGLLPLSPDLKLAVIGPTADSRDALLGNYNGTPSEYITLLRGIQQAARGRVRYARGCDLQSAPDYYEEQTLREAVIAARESDAVVMLMGITPQMEQEDHDRTDIELPAVQRELLEAVCAVGKPIVFVNVSGGAINLSRPHECCGAVLQCFYPGAEGGTALADILFGHVSPSGRLPVTFYRTLDDLPPFEEYSMRGRTYRFYEGAPVYPFGHGLTYGDVSETWLDTDTVRLRSAGKYDTDYTVLKFADEPHRQLVAIRRVFLRAGEEMTVRI